MLNTTNLPKHRLGTRRKKYRWISFTCKPLQLFTEFFLMKYKIKPYLKISTKVSLITKKIVCIQSTCFTRIFFLRWCQMDTWIFQHLNLSHRNDKLLLYIFVNCFVSKKYSTVLELDTESWNTTRQMSKIWSKKLEHSGKKIDSRKNYLLFKDAWKTAIKLMDGSLSAGIVKMEG